MRQARKQILASCFGVLLSLTFATVSAQNFNQIIPMGEWAEYKKVAYGGNPVIVHLRTGYENAVIFPEPINIRSIDNKVIRSETKLSLPNCTITIDVDVVGFKPLARFLEQRVTLRGADTGIIYDLMVSSSPNGSRQPIEVYN